MRNQILHACPTLLTSPGLLCLSGCAERRAALLLIDRLAACRIPMHYHGDFDAAGLQIASQMILGKEMTSWRMNASDYEFGVAHSNILLSNNQPIVETPWDPRLRDCLRIHGKSLIEEMVVDFLIDDLSS